MSDDVLVDWAGVEAGADDAGSRDAGGAGAGERVRSVAHLTDEEILGMDAPGGEAGGRGQGGTDDGPTLRKGGEGWGTRENAERDARGANDESHGTNHESRVTNHDARDGRDESSFAGAQGKPGTGHQSPVTNQGEMPGWMAAAVAADPKNAAEATALWRETREFRETFGSVEEARAVKELLPGGVRDVMSLREATRSVERIDAAIFSGDARAQSEVVAEMARANPAAFRALFAEAARVLAGEEAGGPRQRGTEAGNRADADGAGADGPTLRKNGEGWGTQNQNRERERTFANDRVGVGDRADENRRRDAGATTPGANYDSRVTNHDARGGRDESRLTEHQSPVTGHQSPQFDAAAYASFERTTNDVVARDVRGAIGETLGRVMPEGVAEGAARRMGEDIFNEVHRALAGDRALSEQVAGVLRERRFGADEQRAVAALLAGRAKQMVPSVARRVIGEWTSTVLNTARSKAARQAVAASRVDIAAAGGSMDSMPLRAGSGRGVDYGAMSDEEILGM